MTYQLTSKELDQLDVVMLSKATYDITTNTFNFAFILNGALATDISVQLLECNKRIYDFSNLSRPQRVIALQAIDLIIDQLVGGIHVFEKDELQTVVYFALHSMCMNYGLYTSKGRNLLSFEESTSY